MVSQFKQLYGEQPKSIKIMFPPASPEVFFAQFYKRYGSGSLLKCKGDGEVAETTEEFSKGLEKISDTERGFIQVVCKGPECPYQISNECGRMASLQVILPDLSGIGVWQINTGSYNSIVNINSAIEWLRGLCGRYAMIPITLMRVPQDIAYEGKRSKHYILQIDQNISIGEIQRFVSLTPVERALIPAPDEKKDELFYDANGKKPETQALPAPDEKNASQEAPQSTIVDAEIAKPQENSTEEKPSLKKAFDDDQKSSKRCDELFEGIKTCKTKKTVREYWAMLKNEHYFDGLVADHVSKLKDRMEAYYNSCKQ